MNLKRLFPLLLLILCSADASYAQTVPAPYLYYFSDLAHGFVIERADGTDSRVLAQNVMPPDYTIVAGPGWSPSGKWFAWTGRVDMSPGVSPISGWLISADGTNRLTMLDNVSGDTVEMEWSPSRDLLYVLYRHGELIDDFYLIDADAGKTAVHFTIPDNATTLVHNWTPDGQRLVYVYRSQSPPNDSNKVVAIMSSDGTIEQESISVGTPVRGYDNIDASLSDDGHLLAYRDSKRTDVIVIENILTYEQTTFPLPPGSFIKAINWNPKGDYAFVHTSYDFCPNRYLCAPASLWLLSVSAQTIQLISTNTYPIDYDYDPTIAERTYSVGRPWSPTGDNGVFLTTDNALHVIQPDSLRTTDLSEVGVAHGWIWSSDGHLLLINSGVPSSIFRYDVSTGAREVIGEAGSYYLQQVALSPDNRYFGFPFQHFILDMATGEHIRFSPHNVDSSRGDMGSAGYRWNPDSQWIITSDEYGYAGGIGPPGIAVFKLDGTLRRDLGVCFLSKTCVGWLPDNVIPYLAPGSSQSVLRHPLITLTHNTWVNGVAWSPDGSRLASYDQDNHLHIWQIGQNGANEIEIFASSQECVYWPNPCQLSWSPDGRYIAVGATGYSQTEIQVWDVTTGEQMPGVQGAQIRWSAHGGYEGVSADEFFSPDNSQVVRIRDKSHADLYDVQSGRQVSTIPLSDQFSGLLVWLPMPSRIAFVDQVNTGMWVWNPVSDQIVQMMNSRNLLVYAVAANNSGRLLAGASSLMRVHIWDSASGDLLSELNSYAQAVAFNPTRDWLAAGGSQIVTIWDLSDLDSPH
jgi:WD40 repeat protein